MSRHSSVMAVKRAIGGGESFHGRVDAIVENKGKPYTYSGIFASVAYNIGYAQMDVSLDWNDDRRQKSYQILGLHLGYNTNFQEFSLDGDYLCWKDGENRIMVRFDCD